MKKKKASKEKFLLAVKNSLFILVKLRNENFLIVLVVRGSKGKVSRRRSEREKITHS